MIVHPYRQLRCGSVFVLCMVLAALVFPFRGWAQDTVQLNSVEVTTRKVVISQLGKKYEALDSLTRTQFRFSSLGDALSFNTPVFIKSYGPGGIATTSFRGGNASQTAVLWNGFNIQNAMLGQADLALMPAVLFDEIGVEYGGSSSLFGSGAVGGSIHLNSKPVFGQGLQTAVHLGGGSFGQKSASGKIAFSNKRISSATKLYGIHADNNYTFYDRYQELRRQRNAAYDFSGGMQEFRFLLRPGQTLSLNAWLSANRRRLPAFDPTMESKVWQRDQLLRLTADWNRSRGRFRTTVRSGFFNDRINYDDSLVELYSRSRVETFIAENENFLRWGADQELNLGINFSSSTGHTNNYNGVRSMQRLSLLAGNKFSFFSGRLLVYACARADYFSAGVLPITGNLSLEYAILKKLKAKLNAARIYRQPSLNELYWQPGGNPDLKAEQGYSGEGELTYSDQKAAWRFFVSGAAFSRAIDNWILWVPGAGGNPAPVNLQRVWSRGTETTWELTYSPGAWSVSTRLVTGYVLSTVQKEEQQNSGSLHRQLIYTPRYTVNGRLTIAYRSRLSLSYYHQYLGYRFTSSDNSAWLDPFHLSSVRCNYRFGVRRTAFDLFIACNNLFGVNYTVLAARPMPLRNFEAGISIQFKKVNNQ